MSAVTRSLPATPSGEEDEATLAVGEADAEHGGAGIGDADADRLDRRDRTGTVGIGERDLLEREVAAQREVGLVSASSTEKLIGDRDVATEPDERQRVGGGARGRERELRDSPLASLNVSLIAWPVVLISRKTEPVIERLARAAVARR